MKNLKRLTRKSLKQIIGAGYDENNWGACYINKEWVPTRCIDLCPNRTDPICAAKPLN